MLKALVVEDELDIKQLLVEDLEGKGYRVREAGNGVAAMQRIGEDLPDIIFADVLMPMMDGFALIETLRKNPETADIPVVLVTALNSHDTQQRAKKLGVKYHITKPWEPWALDMVIEEALKPSRRTPNGQAKLQVYPPKLTVHGKPLNNASQ
ncbi:MAG: response regulator [Chloroflexi bacterium]|nr:response regulator [Chloroflexota bacterium]MDA1272398.1 response regulator [Chloroflexota bacterium]PKB58837.1 MAG: hypothetical protein BZY83_04865 [SAR202 cluster bacterium Casp-Chloro-G2]